MRLPCFNAPRLGLIKVILIRKGYSMSEELDPSCATPAYVCGRLFACLAYIQAFERNPSKHGFGANAAMVNGYFGSASTAPRTVFGSLLRQTQFRLNKLKESHARFVTSRNVEMEQCSQRLGNAENWHATFPPMLNAIEQGQFALGCYHQRAAYRAAAVERKARAAENSESSPEGK
mgnify:CR=1 FL=1